MDLTRREFLKTSGAGMGGLVLLGSMDWNFSNGKTPPKSIILKKQALNETYTICCYCAVGCGALITADNGKIVNVEGNPDHPINEGTLCAKGQALGQFHTVDGQDNSRRLTKPQVRRAKSDKWEDISWEQAISEIARKIKTTRDSNWISSVDVGGATYPVNRTDAIVSFGGGELDNEECYLLVKMARALGLVYVEHCARI